MREQALECVPPVRPALTGGRVIARRPTGEQVALETAELSAPEGKGNRLERDPRPATNSVCWQQSRGLGVCIQHTFMTTAHATATETEIRQLVEHWTTALRAKDTAGLMSHYMPDVLVYDLAPPLCLRGADRYRSDWEGWFRSFDGPVGYEVQELSITAADDVAFSMSFNRITGKRTSGENSDIWVRATVCYRKHNGTWKVAHEHFSVPMYMDGSQKAAVDLKPEE